MLYLGMKSGGNRNVVMKTGKRKRLPLCTPFIYNGIIKLMHLRMVRRFRLEGVSEDSNDCQKSSRSPSMGKHSGLVYSQVSQLRGRT